MYNDFLLRILFKEGIDGCCMVGYLAPTRHVLHHVVLYKADRIDGDNPLAAKGRMIDNEESGSNRKS